MRTLFRLIRLGLLGLLVLAGVLAIAAALGVPGAVLGLALVQQAAVLAVDLVKSAWTGLEMLAMGGAGR